MADINLIPREYIERKKGIGAYFSKTTIIIFALVVLGSLFYGGTVFYLKNLDKNMEVISQEILDLENKRDPDTEKIMIDLNERINILKDLLKNHFYWSQALGKIEESTIPEVYISDAGFNIEFEKVNINISGNTTTYTNLARQILSYQEEPLVEKVKVSGISLDEKAGIKFDLAIIFSKNLILEEAEKND